MQIADFSDIATEGVLKVGEVVEVNGRQVFVQVDENKNLSDLFYNGKILKNISVNSFIEIRKGFLSLVGKVEGEKIEEKQPFSGVRKDDNRNRRIITISLIGFIDRTSRFRVGTRELPLIGNEAFVLTDEKVAKIHNLVERGGLSICVAKTDLEEFDIHFPIDGLFNSHIAIFGNTGSGKSNTLASLYQSLFATLDSHNSQGFRESCRYIFFDFNGEYSGDNCLSTNKAVFNLSTQSDGGDKLPISEESLLDIEILSVLADATEKTQKPFLKRAVRFFKKVMAGDQPDQHYKNTLKLLIKRALQLPEKEKAFLILDYLKQILPPIYEDDNSSSNEVELDGDIEWHHSDNRGFKLKSGNNAFLHGNDQNIEQTRAYSHIDQFEFSPNILTKVINFIYLQLISDVLANRAQNEHIAPAVNKLKSKRKDIEKVFNAESNQNLWSNNIIVINLNQVNLEMKKTIPLLISKKVYSDQKNETNKTLNIIIDEAHNILSRESFREAESWKDYRLETFEEIIKEGRKFGVFVTISSQRPNDISPTITSQAHNYFIHRLINQKDLLMISSAVSYIDKLTEASIPSLPTGTCIFSGLASPMPLKLIMNRLNDDQQPKSQTLRYSDILSH